MFTQSRPCAVTDEEGDLLYSLVRMVKPALALETGTGYGISSWRIGEALLANGDCGQLHTCETNPAVLAEAQARCAGLPVEIHQVRGVELIERYTGLRFMLIDSGNVLDRLEELRMIHGDRVAPGGLVVVHDALNVDYVDLCKEFDLRGWPRLTFPTLAGIAIYQRPL